jgi:hypothetical protein
MGERMGERMGDAWGAGLGVADAQGDYADVSDRDDATLGAAAWFDDAEAADLRETRPLPALRALPGNMRNGLLALPAPREPATRDVWAAASTWHVPTALPPLDVALEPTRLQCAITPDRPRQRASRDVRAFCAAPTDKHCAIPRALPHGGMLIPATDRSLRVYRPRVLPRRRGISGSAATLLTFALLMLMAWFTGPVESQSMNFTSLSADVGVGFWQTQSGSAPILGSGGAAAPGVHAPGTASPPSPNTARKATTPSQPPAKAPTTGISPAPFHPWPPRDPWMRVPGYTPYGVREPAHDPYAVAFGQCTWWAQHERRDENLRGMGNARYWAAGARRRGYRVGTVPARGATVVFQPGVQGAGWAGHVAHVLIVYPNGWFLMSEMNAYGNGGGWGRVSFRYAHMGWGVSFIY